MTRPTGLGFRIQVLGSRVLGSGLTRPTEASAATRKTPSARSAPDRSSPVSSAISTAGSGASSRPGAGRVVDCPPQV